MIIQEDTELIQESLNGNTRAQEKLYNKYSGVVKNFISSKYSSYRDVEDDVSEIMIKVFTKLDDFDVEKSRFKSWVISITKNHMIDKWRCNTITLTSGNSCSFSITTDNALANTTYCSTSDGTMTLNNSNTFTTNSCDNIEFENCNSITYISEQLTPQDFTLLDMKYVQGYNYNEIGKEFNVTSSTISNRINYIKTKLKKNNTEIIYD
jgi:RNA polymerase sigma-70 factor, ECF subfamily